MRAGEGEGDLNWPQLLPSFEAAKCRPRTDPFTLCHHHTTRIPLLPAHYGTRADWSPAGAISIPVYVFVLGGVADICLSFSQSSISTTTAATTTTFLLSLKALCAELQFVRKRSLGSCSCSCRLLCSLLHSLDWL